MPEDSEEEQEDENI